MKIDIFAALFTLRIMSLPKFNVKIAPNLTQFISGLVLENNLYRLL